MILNKATSLVVGAAALPFRAGTVPRADIAAQWPVILNLLAGSPAGARAVAGWGGQGHAAVLDHALQGHRRASGPDRRRASLRP